LKYLDFKKGSAKGGKYELKINLVARINLKEAAIWKGFWGTSLELNLARTYPGQ